MYGCGVLAASIDAFNSEDVKFDTKPVTLHASDCAVHNMPAYPNGPCDCQPKGETMNEQELEKQLQNKPAPRVTLAEIEALMARVQYLGGRVGETTSTVVHAFLDGEFMLASGHSACVSKANFDADLGFKMAKENAEKKARDALWQFEGYYLRCKLRKENDAPSAFVDGQAYP